MRVVTQHAVIANLVAFRCIPIARHSAVRPMVIVTFLRAVALSTQRHRLGRRNDGAIGEMEHRAVRLVVAGEAAQAPMGEHNVCVDGETVALPATEGHATIHVAGRTRHRNVGVFGGQGQRLRSADDGGLWDA